MPSHAQNSITCLFKCWRDIKFAPAKVHVELTPTLFKISVDGDRLIGGRLYAEIKEEDSTWQISDGVLEATLLKRSRRGNYANGHTNAETFWRYFIIANVCRIDFTKVERAHLTKWLTHCRCVWTGTPALECLQGHPPLLYYNSHVEPEARTGWKPSITSKRARPMIAKSRGSRL